jgi:hypothetical protein
MRGRKDLINGFCLFWSAVAGLVASLELQSSLLVLFVALGGSGAFLYTRGLWSLAGRLTTGKLMLLVAIVGLNLAAWRSELGPLIMACLFVSMFVPVAGQPRGSGL